MLNKKFKTRKESRLNSDWAEKPHAITIWALVVDKHLESQLMIYYQNSVASICVKTNATHLIMFGNSLRA